MYSSVAEGGGRGAASGLWLEGRVGVRGRFRYIFRVRLGLGNHILTRIKLLGW